MKQQITFRLDTEKIHWLRTCAEIENRTIVSVLENALDAYFYWKDRPDYPRNISN